MDQKRKNTSTCWIQHKVFYLPWDTTIRAGTMVGSPPQRTTENMIQFCFLFYVSVNYYQLRSQLSNNQFLFYFKKKRIFEKYVLVDNDPMNEKNEVNLSLEVV
jgi:hypothetical protein